MEGVCVSTTGLVGWSASQSVKTISQSTNHSTNQSTNQSVNQSVSQRISQSTNQSQLISQQVGQSIHLLFFGDIVLFDRQSACQSWNTLMSCRELQLWLVVVSDTALPPVLLLGKSSV